MDAGRYSKFGGSVATGLSASEQALLGKLGERAPSLARLISISGNTVEAREALQELNRLLMKSHDSKTPRR
jgi:hypothetical protein